MNHLGLLLHSVALVHPHVGQSDANDNTVTLTCMFNTVGSPTQPGLFCVTEAGEDLHVLRCPVQQDLHFPRVLLPFGNYLNTHKTWHHTCTGLCVFAMCVCLCVCVITVLWKTTLCPLPRLSMCVARLRRMARWRMASMV